MVWACAVHVPRTLTGTGWGGGGVHTRRVLGSLPLWGPRFRSGIRVPLPPQRPLLPLPTPSPWWPPCLGLGSEAALRARAPSPQPGSLLRGWCTGLSLWQAPTPSCAGPLLQGCSWAPWFLTPGFHWGGCGGGGVADHLSSSHSIPTHTGLSVVGPSFSDLTEALSSESSWTRSAPASILALRLHSPSCRVPSMHCAAPWGPGFLSF